MFEVKGKYNTAKIFASTVDRNAIKQVQDLCNLDYLGGSTIRMMPDIHAGSGCTIGTTMTLTDKVAPQFVGVDIGCGMLTVQLEKREIDLPGLDFAIRNDIPSGAEINNVPHPYISQTRLEELWCVTQSDFHFKKDIALKSLCSLGGGNHFIECDKDDEGNLYLVVHTGSRYVGKSVAEFYQKRAFEKLNFCGYYRKIAEEAARKRLICSMKKDGKQKQISKVLESFHYTPDVCSTYIPEEFVYCEHELFDAYIHDMKIVQEYAVWNRAAIIDTIMKRIGLHEADRFQTIHNYIDTDNMILRKGAVSAQKRERLLIPISMKDGALICAGKGNPDWNYSAPHGAGRLLSRSEAKDTLSMDEFRKQMTGIYSSSISESTLDEAPMAYKPLDDIVKNISDTVQIEKNIRPIYNFKK